MAAHGGGDKQERTLTESLQALTLQIDEGSNHKVKVLETKMDTTVDEMTKQVEATEAFLEPRRRTPRQIGEARQPDAHTEDTPTGTIST